MEKDGQFADFDTKQVYHDSQERALLESTRNFVVEFGKENAGIAFDFQAEAIDALIQKPGLAERPVRWINIWAPHQQSDTIDVLAKRYGFSNRLQAIIKSVPVESKPQDKPSGLLRTKLYRKDDIELATKGMASVDLQRPTSMSKYGDTSHYALAEQMVHYQSIDVGDSFICVGANWIHELKPTVDSLDSEDIAEGRQRRLWSWLILCGDHTVVSLHEHPGVVDNIEDLRAMRANTLSVLSQLSNCGHGSADPISLQTVRQALQSDGRQDNPGIEGASLLFYYLFDDWRAVYSTVATYGTRLQELQNAILQEASRKNSSSPNSQIIPRLHLLGGQIRRSQHLYEGYKNLIKRILEPKPPHLHGASFSRSLSDLDASQESKGLTLARSAAQRFERLSDRLALLILSETKEFLAEKDALISTYFNINAQKDSEATARLTRSATLLAKLSVLFLPVSLMTSYFSVQIDDLQGVYTSKDYWYAFAVLMSISFLFLFFFSRLLMWITETLDKWVKGLGKACRNYLTRTLRRRDEVQT